MSGGHTSLYENDPNCHKYDNLNKNINNDTTEL